jgi:hypothetical protein
MESVSPRATRAHVYHVDLSDAVPGYKYVLKAVGSKQPLSEPRRRHVRRRDWPTRASPTSPTKT